MNINFRKAVRDDVPNIIRLLADDPLGAEREKYVVWCGKKQDRHNNAYHLVLSVFV